jgi:hypothetical protein
MFGGLFIAFNPNTGKETFEEMLCALIFLLCNDKELNCFSFTFGFYLNATPNSINSKNFLFIQSVQVEFG